MKYWINKDIDKGRTMFKFNIFGLDHIDMMDCMNDMQYKLSDNKLETAARAIL